MFRLKMQLNVLIKLDKSLFYKVVAISLIVGVFTTKLNASTPSPYSFLRNGLSARATGLAGTVVSFDEDVSGLFINPALIATHSGNNFSTTFLKHVLDINSGNVTYLYQDKELGSFAGSIVYTNFGSFDYYDAQGNPTGGSFSGNLISLAGSYANLLASNLHAGISGKLIFNQLENMDGFAVAIDAGLLYKLADNRTNLGFSILNAGAELKKIGTEKSDLPLSVNIGFNHRLRGLPLNFNLGFNHLNQDYGNFFSRFSNINIGGELYFGEYVQVRLGFDNYIRRNIAAEQNKGLTGISAGIGIVTEIINVDYGISIYTSDLFLHRFSINLKI